MAMRPASHSALSQRERRAAEADRLRFALFDGRQLGRLRRALAAQTGTRCADVPIARPRRSAP
eukprot:6584443-Prymnesium_polylepis.1